MKTKLKKAWKWFRRLDPIWKLRKFGVWMVKSAQYAWFLRDDEDWDHAFIFNLLKYKLSRTRKCILKNSFIVADKRVARQIAYAEYLIDQVNGQYFNEGLRAMHAAKWGKSKFHLCNDRELIPELHGTTWLSSYEKATTKEDLDRAQEEMGKIYDFERMKWDEYNDRLFRHLRKYIHHWWD